MLSGVTSPNRLVESARVVYGFRGVDVEMFVVVRSSGMASQVGIPEAYKVALKYGKPLVVLPTMRDVLEYLRFDDLYLVLPGLGNARRLDEVELPDRRYALVFVGEEHGRSDVPAEVLTIPELPPDAPPQATIAVALYTISRRAPGGGRG
mgnify:CR=1 FL=1